MRLTSPGQAAPTAVAGARPLAGAGRPAWVSLLAAMIGGLSQAAAFAPVGLWPLAVVGPALLVVALWQVRLRTAIASGVVFGLAFFFPLLSWLVNVAWYVWVALALAETVVFAVETIGQWLLLRFRAWPLAVAAWWVTAEAIRGRWPWGFPWGRLVMSQATSPAGRWVAVVGPPLVTFLLGLVGACLAWLVIAVVAGSADANGMGRVRNRIAAGAALAVTAGLALSGAFLPIGTSSASVPTARVAAIQGNVPHARNLPSLLRATTVTQNHAAATERLAAQVRDHVKPAPDLIIWPENSTDQDPRLDPYIYGVINTAVADIGKPVLVGAVLQNPVRNAGLLWLPGKGPVAAYIKRKLVPFGEVIPFRGLLSKITSLTSLQPVNFTPGKRPVVFHIGQIYLGDVICYEVGFDGLVSSEVTAGANLLAMQTNDADFELDGQTGETSQQLDMARIRAMEYDRAVVVASTTGVSAIIGPDGSLLASTRTWRAAEIAAAVPLLTTTTLAERLGGWPEGLITAATFLAVAWAAGLAVRQRRRERHPQSTAPAQ
ncbi:MAG TPA: apolipoprotein N-acyltransferase [Streptosporangiaceae bacterium]|nr:apolipoprotein N-acyltransferase [Streptosporangiaceae bacterium]